MVSSVAHSSQPGNCHSYRIRGASHVIERDCVVHSGVGHCKRNGTAQADGESAAGNFAFNVVRAFAFTRPSVTAFVAVETLITSIFVKPAGVTEVFKVAFTVSLVAPVPVSLSRELRV